MVDRAARDRAAACIEGFLAEQLTAFELDAALTEGAHTDDRTLQSVGQEVWGFYDDCTDHLVACDRPRWDYLHRLLLLLRSDAECVVDPVRWRWGWPQGASVAALAVFVVVACQNGWDDTLVLVTWPFGLASVAIYWLGRLAPAAQRSATLPFATLTELRGVWRRVPGFRKHRLPDRVANRRIRPVADPLMAVAKYVPWLLFGPVVLCFQALPWREWPVRVEVASTSADS